MYYQDTMNNVEITLNDNGFHFTYKNGTTIRFTPYENGFSVNCMSLGSLMKIKGGDNHIFHVEIIESFERKSIV